MTRALRTLAALAVMGALGWFCFHAAAGQSGSPDQLVPAPSAKTSAWLTPKKIADFMERLEEQDKDEAAEMRDLLQENPSAFECRLREIERKWFRHDIRNMAFGAAGGLGLFLYGMGLMSDGLKKVAGQKLKKLLGSLTRNRIAAILVGAGVTALIQSSSATTVMTIGFVNAGLLTLKQALCVILGANVGTTFTAWVVSFFGMFKISIYILPIVGLGFLLSVGGRTARTRNLGQIMLGFGILFLGIDFMEEGFKPMRDYSDVQAALIWVGTHRILAVVAGTVITMLVQSSSASIAMIQTLAFAGAFGDNWHQVLGASIPLLLGTNIGTTITAQLAALRTSRNAKRTAWGHTIFNAIGVVYLMPFVWVGIYAYVVKWIVHILTPLELTQATIMMHIAVAHTVFNLVNTAVFLPMINALEAILLKILPVTKQEAARRPVTLEEHLLDTPPIALEQSEREMVRMARAARRAVEAAVDGILSDDRKKLDSVRELEDFTDEFQLEITSYLTALSKRQLSDEVSTKLPVLLHIVNDLERIGDHAVNIAQIGARKIEQNLAFSEFAVGEAQSLRTEVLEMFDEAIASLAENDPVKAKAALAHENNLNRMQIDFRRSHVQRMSDGVSSAQKGLIFIDLVDNVEKIGDHLTNIVQAVAGGLNWEGAEPRFIPVD